MKPLYLETGKQIQVCLDGPALSVHKPGEAGRLFPLARLSRVVSGTDVIWQQAALLALARVGVPVVFVEAQGGVVARLLGMAGERSSLVQQLEEVLVQPQGLTRYGDWCEHCRRAQLLAIGRLYPWLGRLPEGGYLERRIRQLLKEEDAKEILIGMEHLRSRVFAWVTERLAHLGIGAQTPHLTGGIIDLPCDLATILQWQILVRWLALMLRYPAMRNSASAAGVRHDEHRITRCYQVLEAGLEQAGRTLIARLHLWTATRDCDS